MICGLMIQPLSQDMANFYYLGQGRSKGLSQKLAFEPILRASFFEKMLALSNKKSTFVLVSGFFGCCIFAILFK